MSSRNRRLSAAERAAAPKIYEALLEGKRLKEAGKSVSEVHEAVVRQIEADPLLRVEYFSIVDSNTLEDAKEWCGATTGCITVFCGEVRLIDHITFES